MKTQWRVLQVDAHGDIAPVMAYRHEKWAMSALKRETPPAGAILTIEGQRNDAGGWQGFKRTGIVKGTPTTAAQKRWTTADATFYPAGTEPQYAEVAA